MPAELAVLGRADDIKQGNNYQVHNDDRRPSFNIVLAANDKWRNEGNDEDSNDDR